MRLGKTTFISIVLILFILWVISIDVVGWKYTTITNNNNNNKIELVVARYNETLDWLQEEPFHRHPAIIYNKGKNDDFMKTDNIRAIVPVENVGRESHS